MGEEEDEETWFSYEGCAIIIGFIIATLLVALLAMILFNQ
jgi:tetrahydromethanopterin S-methyltransferase subunit B